MVHGVQVALIQLQSSHETGTSRNEGATCAPK